jgi:hypothetical protein
VSWIEMEFSPVICKESCGIYCISPFPFLPFLQSWTANG